MDDFWRCAAESWAPKVGDPTPVGWIVTLGYFYTIALILYMLRKLRKIGPDKRPAYVQFWIIVASVYLLLGLNKQLDLQTFVTATGRCMSRMEGWYEERRGVQLTMILAGLAVGSSGLFVFVWLFRDLTHRCKLAFIGLGISALFITLRAISFHHVDQIFALRLLDIKVHAMMEMTGIALVAINAASLAMHRVTRFGAEPDEWRRNPSPPVTQPVTPPLQPQQEANAG